MAHEKRSVSRRPSGDSSITNGVFPPWPDPDTGPPPGTACKLRMCAGGESSGLLFIFLALIVLFYAAAAVIDFFF